MTQPISGPAYSKQGHAARPVHRCQQPAVLNNADAPNRPLCPNDSTTPAFSPDNIPALRWARSGVSIIQFLGDEIEGSDLDANELEGSSKVTAIH